MDHGLLRSIESPADLKALSRAELRRLVAQLRAYVVQSVSRTGGHLSSNLGTVELTIALHQVFDTPRDRLVWDVGHQTYAHKILTGRRDRMDTLRTLDGLSGFPRRDESEYDAFGTAHSSTSVSAALGKAVAARYRSDPRRVVAIIGDGAMSAGMAFEALNNAAGAGVDVLVVLNDNDMSISPPVGALSRHLARLMSGRFYAAARHTAKSALRPLPPLFELARSLEGCVKAQVAPGGIFEELGFGYTGPIDGHDLDALIPALEVLRGKTGPQLLHVVTRKGCGYGFAEADPVAYHGPGRFDPVEGIKKPAAPQRASFTSIFGDWLCDMAEADPRLVGITPAMREGSGLVEFERRFPSRYFDVGIAEQHAVTFAAGLACEGLKPVVAIYSTFLQRAYDQFIHDVALQKLPVVFALDRAGLVGADGATHAGAYDIAFVRCIPNMSVIVPADENECRQALCTAFLQDHPVTVRYPRGSGVGAKVERSMNGLPFGRGELRRECRHARAGHRIAIVAFGTLLHPALDAAERLDATVANARFVKPLDMDLIVDLARRHDAIVTVEEGCTMGGAGSAVAEALHAAGITIPMLMLGLPDAFVEHGDTQLLLAKCGLDAAGIEHAVIDRFGSQPRRMRPAVNF
jgi:1-deoxy-D-xylulose-5-phosphate synthase